MDRDGEVMTMPEIPNWCPPHTMLYTGDQLRQARADVLRAFKENVRALLRHPVDFSVDYAACNAVQQELDRMADEIEKGETP